MVNQSKFTFVVVDQWWSMIDNGEWTVNNGEWTTIDNDSYQRWSMVKNGTVLTSWYYEWESWLVVLLIVDIVVHHDQ